jgi:phosphate transport system permease protein
MRRPADRLSEAAIESLIRVCGVSSILFVFGILYFVISEGTGALATISLQDFLFTSYWNPTSAGGPRYGTVALVAGSLSVTLLAMLIAAPLGLGAACFLAEYCNGFWKESLKILIEVLAAIPSVVWGFVGLMVMNPLIVALTGAPIGLNVLNGGIILALMSVPIIASLAEDALKAVPDSFREAAVAMGATRWQVLSRVLLPAARNGLLAALLLGMGRAIGETMAVLMATGHSAQIPQSVLDSTRTLTATIAAELGEAAVGSEHYQVLFLVGVQLLTITFAINLAADLIIRGRRSKR